MTVLLGVPCGTILGSMNHESIVGLSRYYLVTIIQLYPYREGAQQILQFELGRLKWMPLFEYGASMRG